MGSVTVRYWASMREAAGTVEERVDAATLADALKTIRANHADRPRFGKVLDVCSLLVDDVPANTRAPEDVTLQTGSVIEVLPPFAGG